MFVCQTPAKVNCDRVIIVIVVFMIFNLIHIHYNVQVRDQQGDKAGVELITGDIIAHYSELIWICR